MTSTTHTGFSPLKTHTGNAIVDASNTYRTVQATLYEVVQNSIDAGAKNVWISVEYRSKSRTIIVRDDGEGVSLEKFNEALSNVYQTIKVLGKYGRFGKGLVAPVTKCRKYEFTAYDPDANLYRMWTFEREAIQSEADASMIPFVQRPSLMEPIPGRKSIKRQPWSTEVKMSSVTKDKRISSIEPKTFKDEVVRQFRAEMLARGIQIHFSISTKSGETHEETFSANAYTGVPIGAEYYYIDGVDATFQLFEARLGPGGRKGEVGVGCKDNPFRFSIRNYFTHNGTEGITPEAVKFFRSGFIEGDIIVNGLELDSRRDRFDQGDGIRSLNICLQTWYRDIGRQIAERISSDSMRERFLQGGKAAVRTAEKVLSAKNAEQIWDFIQTFKIGSVGGGHKPPKDAEKVGETDTNVVRPGSDHSNVERKVFGPRKRSSKPRKPPEKDNPGDMPWLFAGTGSRKRIFVKSDSLGLTVELIEMEGSSDMWELDTTTGTLYINQRHYTLARVADNDSTLEEYLTDLIIHALNFESQFSSGISSDESRTDALELVGNILDSVATKLLMKV